MIDKFLIKNCNLKPADIPDLTLTEIWLYIEAFKEKKEDDDWSSKVVATAVAAREEKKMTLMERLDLEEWAWRGA